MKIAYVQEARRRGRFADVATHLPGLIRDLHTSIVAGRDVAREHGETATLAVAAWGTTVALLTDRMLDVAQAELDAVTLPATTSATAGVLGGLAMTRALVASVDKRPGDVDAPMEAADKLTQPHPVRPGRPC